MRLLFSISFIALLLCSNLSKVWILIDFKIHQEFIAANLCVNRDVPNSCCQGKCYVIKQVKEQEEQQEYPESISRKQLPINLQTNSRFTFHIMNILDSKAVTTILLLPKGFFELNNHYSFDYLTAIFHPPRIF